MPDPRVPDGERGPGLVVAFQLRGRDEDLAALRAVLDGVRQQVRHHPLDPSLIPVAHEPRDIALDLDGVARAHVPVLGHQAVRDLHEVGRPEVELDRLAHPPARDVEELVDEADELGGALVDRGEALDDRAGRLARLPGEGAMEQARAAHDDRGRGLQVV